MAPGNVQGFGHCKDLSADAANRYSTREIERGPGYSTTCDQVNCAVEILSGSAACPRSSARLRMVPGTTQKALPEETARKRRAGHFAPIYPWQKLSVVQAQRSLRLGKAIFQIGSRAPRHIMSCSRRKGYGTPCAYATTKVVAEYFVVRNGASRASR